jgi:23S rRNA (cytosine1962-C5)-methyltransferase
MIDDVVKFTERELRRGKKYHAIFLDPPSFGRGPKSEVWKIEEHLPVLLNTIEGLLASDFAFIHLSAHSPGFTPQTLVNLLAPFRRGREASYQCRGGEMLICEESGRLLPCGAYGIVEGKKP